MPSLPPTMNVNWYITCSACKHSEFISVEWFKNTRERYGINKPLTWDRLVCKECNGRRITLSRSLPETRQQYAARISHEKEKAAVQRFEKNVGEWNGDPYWDDYDRLAEQDREQYDAFDHYYVDGVKVG